MRDPDLALLTGLQPFTRLNAEQWALLVAEVSTAGDIRKASRTVQEELAACKERILKHPGHANQSVHGLRGKGGAPAGGSGSAGGGDAGGISAGDSLDRKPNAEGTNVKVTGPVKSKGKRGVITYSNSSGTFHSVQFSNGSSGDFSGSDLTAL